MSFKKSDAAERALSVVLDEARRTSPPEIDWADVETKLNRAVELPAPSLAHRGRPGFLLALPVAAALGLAGYWLVPRSEPAAAPSAQSDGKVDGDALRADELLASDATPIQVVHAGRARWTLEPNGRARVLERGGVVRLQLLAGSLKASVVPSEQAERFVVEAAGTRVAVHGTVFRVQLDGERTLVEVEEGVVAVSPRERPAAQVLLRAPRRGEFSLEGASLAAHDSAPSASARLRMSHPPPRRQNSAASSPEVAASAAAPETALPSEARSSLTIGQAEAGVASAVAAIVRCFKEHTEGSPGVRVSARTELTLLVSPDGAVDEVSFAPPLSPAVQSCGQREAATVRFAPSSEGAALTRVLELSR